MSDKRRLPTVWRLAGLLALAALAGCRGTEIEDAVDKVEWFSNMRDQVAVEPYEEAARMPPEGTVMVDAGIPLMGTPDDYTEVANPFPTTADSRERGKERYDIYCSVCHGPEGVGGGSIEGPYPRGLIASLVSERAQGLSDGYIFGMISAGRGLMPNYRRLPQEERWHVVNYVRRLQESSGEQGN